MEKRKVLTQWIGALLIFILFLALGIDAREHTGSPDPSIQNRPDIVTIDTMKIYGEIDRSPVQFPHDLHQKYLEKKGKDCLACHLEKDGNLSLSFKRFNETDKKTVMNIYHDNCIGCHKKAKATGDKNGPVVCAQCHTRQPKYIASQQPLPFDKSLHSRHVKAQQNKCDSCHHQYNPLTKKLFYEKGKEDSCRYCHKDETEENRISMRLASHQSCLQCHRDTLSKKKTAGPILCAGCHDTKEQARIKVLDGVPRYDRNQPDVVLMKTGNKNIKTHMNPVPFNHRTHENYNDTCRICHHKDLQPCVKCHTLSGSKEGDGLNVMQVMHHENANQSCIGCHNATKSSKECAGCHTRMSTKASDDTQCLTCHIKRPVQNITPVDEIAFAKILISSKKINSVAFNESDIPEAVVIKEMVDKFGEVNFPHRKIVNALRTGINKSKLAEAFHNSANTVCQGCHHNSPVSKTPPKCGNCHGQPFSETNPFMPGKMGAYHRQCIGCHKEMGIKKPAGCTECHKER